MRNIKSILIGLILGLFILFSAAVSISYFYEEEVSQYLLEELNEILLSEIEVEDINFSLIAKFPKASLELKNVVAYSKEGFYSNIMGYDTDTLFSAQSIYVQMDLLNLISRDLTISSIHFDRGDIKLFVDHLGDPNYIFWKQNKKNREDKEFSLKLNEVKITNSKLLYVNNSNKLLLKSEIDKLDFEGDFTSDNYLMKIKANQKIDRLNIENIDYMIDKNVKAKLDLDIVGNLIKFKNGNLQLEDLDFNLNGDIERTDRKKIDLLISGKNLNLKSFVKNLPPKLIAEFPNIIGQKGTATINLSISGENLKVNKPHFEAFFILNNAQLFDLEREMRLSNVNINGEFTNGAQNNARSSRITFKTFSSKLESNSFQGDFELTNFKDPKIKLNLNSELYLDEIKEIFKVDTIDILEGFAKARISYSGSYKELRSFGFRDLFTKDYEVSLQLSDGSVKFQNHPLLLNNISGNIELKRTLYTDSLFFKINENDFLIKGRISKLFEYFNEKEIFNINARLYSRKINLNGLALLFKTDNSKSNEGFRFPEKIALQLRLNIENFEVGKFYATDIGGNLNYKPKMFSLHEISFNSMNGNVKAGGVIIQKFNNDFLVRTQSRLSNININKLFYAFNNFGQSFISNQNVEGNLTGDVYFSSEFSDQIKIYNQTISSESDIEITDGELNQFEPLMGLSKFIDVDELKHIQFSTIQNTITIRNEQIIIPKMDIKSSAIDIAASGIHHFNSNYEYHVNLLLSDLLSGKFRKSKRKRQQDEEIEEDQDGRMRLYLLVEGDEDINKVRYDRKAARTERESSLKNEKNELKELLNEEYGWYQNDTTLRKTEKEQDAFQIEFDENKKSEKKPNKKNKNEQKFIIEWEEDTSKIK